MHRGQEFCGETDTRRIPDDAIDPARRAERSLSGPSRIFVHPVADLVGSERCAAIEASAKRTGCNLGTVVARVSVSVSNFRRKLCNAVLVIGLPVHASLV
jgi:hypothetical protein